MHSLYVLIFLCCWFPGEPWLPSAWGDQQEHAGTHLAHVRWRPAADLHTNAKRLVSPLHELLSLQKPAQHSVRAVPWILGWWWPVIFQLSVPPLTFHPYQLFKHFFFCMFSVGLHEPGLGPGPSQGSQRYFDLHLTEDTQVSKSPEGSTSQVLLQINIAKTLQRNMNTFCFCFLSFDRNNLFYLCSEFFMVCCFFLFFCMIVWGEWFLL